MYVTKEVVEKIKDIKVRIWPIDITKPSDKLLTIIDFYKENNNQ